MRPCNTATRVWADSSGAFEESLLLILGAIEVVDGACLHGGGGVGLAGLLENNARSDEASDNTKAAI
jgi:hypothetical protein